LRVRRASKRTIDVKPIPFNRLSVTEKHDGSHAAKKLRHSARPPVVMDGASVITHLQGRQRPRPGAGPRRYGTPYYGGRLREGVVLRGAHGREEVERKEVVCSSSEAIKAHRQCDPIHGGVFSLLSSCRFVSLPVGPREFEKFPVPIRASIARKVGARFPKQ